MLPFNLLFKAVLSLKVNFSGDAILTVIEIFKVELIYARSFDSLLMGDFYGVVSLLSLSGGWIECIVDVVVIEFDHVFVF